MTHDHHPEPCERVQLYVNAVVCPPSGAASASGYCDNIVDQVDYVDDIVVEKTTRRIEGRDTVTVRIEANVPHQCWAPIGKALDEVSRVVPDTFNIDTDTCQLIERTAI